MISAHFYDILTSIQPRLRFGHPYVRGPQASPQPSGNGTIPAKRRSNRAKYLLKLLYNPIEKVKGISQEQLDKAIAQHPRLLEVYDLIHNFKTILAAGYVDELGPWLAFAKCLGSPDIDSFVNGVLRDMDAVENAILFGYSNGLAEGSVNKIKRIKHTMYGRAGFSTLRTKTLMYEFWKDIN